MEVDPDEVNLEDHAQQHGIDSTLFLPFVIARLQSDNEKREATLSIHLRDIVERGETTRRLRLSWPERLRPVQSLGVQDHTVTEWAALGIASIVLPLYTGLRIREVASQGDAFDYWVEEKSGSWRPIRMAWTVLSW